MKKIYSKPCVSGYFSIEPDPLLKPSIEVGGSGGDTNPGDLEEGDLANRKSDGPDDLLPWD